MKRRMGLCYKCSYAVLAPGPRVGGVRSQAIIGCKKSTDFDMGKNCPLHQMVVTRAAFVKDCFTLVLTTTFIGKDGLARCLSTTGIDSLETAQAMCDHLGLDVKCTET